MLVPAQLRRHCIICQTSRWRVWQMMPSELELERLADGHTALIDGDWTSKLRTEIMFFRGESLDQVLDTYAPLLKLCSETTL